MKAIALAFAALLLTATVANAATTAPTQPYTGTEIQPYAWMSLEKLVPALQAAGLAMESMAVEEFEVHAHKAE